MDSLDKGSRGTKKPSPSLRAKNSAEALVRSGGENAKLSICQAESSRHIWFFFSSFVFLEEATVWSWINISFFFLFSMSGQASDTSLYQHVFIQGPWCPTLQCTHNIPCLCECVSHCPDCQLGVVCMYVVNCSEAIRDNKTIKFLSLDWNLAK